MKALVYPRYGPPEVLELRDVPIPAVPAAGLLVRVGAASVNPADWHHLTGIPYLVRLSSGLRKPKTGNIGIDFAGRVEAVGPEVEAVQPGEQVFGARMGAFAEYVAVTEAFARMPSNVTLEEAAAVPVAAVTALQGLRDKGGVRAGQDVLINGASGGVGTFAVQIAKALGAEVTAVCSTRNVETVRSLGADEVIDYTTQDFTRNGRRYDLMLDIAGSRPWSECKRVLRDDATIVIVGGPKTNRWIGPLGHAIAMRTSSVAASRTVVAPFLANATGADLEFLRELLEHDKVRPVIDRRYGFGDVPEALRYVGNGHAKGKVVITF